MKRKFGLLFLIFAFFIPVYVNASIITYDRDIDTLSVPSDIKVTDSNKTAIINTPLVDSKEKIYDYADLFTDFEEEDLYNKTLEFISSYNIDLIIVTIDHNNKSDSENYAADFFDYNEFGINKSRDGILYLIDMENRYVYVYTSGKAILYLDDDRIDTIVDISYDYLHYGNYYDGALSFLDKSNEFINDGIPSSNSNYTIDENGNYVIVKKKSVNFFISTIAAFIISTVIVLIFKSKHKGIHLATNADIYLDSSRTKEIVKNDRFISSHTSKVPIPRNTGSGGSSGGGSSIRVGSSGRSHGGGGRHF